MKERQWVQHISGVGEKWKVQFEDDVEYCVVAKAPGGNEHYLPKSEYVPCDPPEKWVDVTAECTVGRGVLISHRGVEVSTENGYRLRERGAPYQGSFVIEKKVPA